MPRAMPRSRARHKSAVGMRGFTAYSGRGAPQRLDAHNESQSKQGGIRAHRGRRCGAGAGARPRSAWRSIGQRLPPSRIGPAAPARAGTDRSGQSGCGAACRAPGTNAAAHTNTDPGPNCHTAGRDGPAARTAPCPAASDRVRPPSSVSKSTGSNGKCCVTAGSAALPVGDAILRRRSHTVDSNRPRAASRQQCRIELTRKA